MSLGKEQDALLALEKVIEINPSSKHAYCEAGKIYFNKGELEKAEENFAQYLKFVRGDRDVNVYLAKIYLALEKYSHVISILQNFSNKDDECLILLAKAYWRKGNLQRAEEILNSVNDRENTEVLRLLGIVLSSQGKIELAGKCLNKAVDFSEDKFFVLLKIGKDLMDARKYSLALDFLKRAYSYNQDSSKLCFYLSKCCLETENLKEALNYISRVKEDEQEFDDYNLVFGEIEYRLNKYKSSLERFDAHIEIHPDSEKAWLYKGMILINIGHLSEAEDSFKRLLMLNPFRAEANFFLARIYHLKGKNVQAISLLNDVIENTPNYINAYIEIARIYREEKRSGEAISLLERAMMNEPENSELISELAWAYYEKRLVNEAQKLLEKLLITNPQMSSPYYLMAKIHGEHNELDRSIMLLQKALSFEVDSIEIRTSLADAYDSIGSHDKAINVLEEISSEKDECIFSKLGDLYSKQGNIERALLNYEKSNSFIKMAELYIESGEYDQARNCLDSLEDNDNEDVYYLRALSEYKVGNMSKAREWLDRFSIINENSLKLNALIFEAENDFENALSCYQKLLDEFGMRFSDKLAICLEKTGERGKAIMELEDDIKRRGISLENSVLLSKLYFDSKKFKLAAEFIEKLEDDQKNASLYSILGDCYFELKDYDKARESYQKVIQDPDISLAERDRIQTRIGDIYSYIQDFNSAIYEYKAVVSRKENSEVLFKLGESYYKAGLLEDSLFVFQKLRSISPEDPMTRIYLSRLYRLKDRLDEAEKELEGVDFTKNGLSGLADYEKAMIYLINNKQQMAYDILLTIYDDMSEFQNINYYLGVIKHDRKEYSEAIKYFKKQIQLDSNHSDSYIKLADCFLKTENLVEAQKLLKTIIERWPDAESHFRLGNIYWKQNMLDQAGKMMEKALHYDPRNFDVMLNLGKILMDRGKIDDAISYLEKATYISPDSYDLRVTLGRAYESAHMMNEAIAQLEKAKELSLDMPEAYYYLALLYQKIGHDEKSFSLYKELEQKAPDFKDSILKLAILEKSLGEISSAREHLEKYINGHEEDINAIFELGTIYFQDNNLDSGLKCFEKVILNDPEKSEAYYYLAQIYNTKGLNEDSIRLLNKAIEINPNFAEANFELGKIYKERGELRKSMLSLERSIQLRLNNIEYLSELGDVYLELGREREAEEIFHKLIYLDSSCFEAFYKLGTIEMGKENYSGAIDYFRKASDIKEKDPELLYSLGVVFWKSKEFDKAVAALQKFKEHFPEQKNRASKLLADIYYSRDMITETVNEIKKAMEEDPDPELRIKLAKCFVRIGKLFEAEPLLMDAIALLPENQEALEILGNIYMKREKFEDAIRYFEKILRKRENDSRLMKKLAICYEGLEENEKARLIYQRLSEANPGDYNINLSLGKIFLKMNMSDNAIVVLEKTRKIEPTRGEPYTLLGDLYSSKGMMEEAISYYKKALEVDPANIGAKLSLADIYGEKRLYDRAIASYKEIINSNPKLVEAHEKLADIYMQRELYDYSVDELKKVVELRPDGANAYFKLANIFMELSRTEDAIKYYEEGLKRDSRNIDNRFKLAELYLKKYRLDDAISEYKRIIAIDEENVDAHFFLGKAYREKGMIDEAVGEFILVVNIAPVDSKVAKEAQEMLKPKRINSNFWKELEK